MFVTPRTSREHNSSSNKFRFFDKLLILQLRIVRFFEPDLSSNLLKLWTE